MDSRSTSDPRRPEGGGQRASASGGSWPSFAATTFSGGTLAGEATPMECPTDPSLGRVQGLDSVGGFIGFGVWRVGQR